MIEIPRAAITADQIAEVAEFFSFGTNDLTQMTFGYSRDDAGKFLPEYIRKGILKTDPFAVLDQEGVGRLVSGDVLTFLPPFLRKNSRRTKSAAAVALGFSSFLPVSSPAGSARPLLPTSAARRSDQWAWDPVHYNKHPPG